jgi:protein gp37
VELIESELEKPLHWRRPRRIFVNSISDTFHESVDEKWLNRIFAITGRCPQHVFLILTKRAERMSAYLQKVAALVGVLPNVWLGASVENQAAADERIPHLLRTPAAKRFVSVEPMLGPIDPTEIRCRNGWTVDALKGDYSFEHPPAHDHGGGLECHDGGPKLDWVIVGGESGPGARPMHPDWVRSLRDQCQAAGVPFHFKQWGAWGPDRTIQHIQHRDRAGHLVVMETAHSSDRKQIGKQTAWCYPPQCSGEFGPIEVLAPFGKRAAGCLLDGKEWKEFPR